MAYMSEERKPLSKKMRFDVFKRDGFQCQYCGTTPPAIDMVEHTFRGYFAFSFKDRFRESVRIFLQHMTVYEVMDAMNRACARIPRQEDAIKYFCGICWKTIKGDNNG